MNWLARSLIFSDIVLSTLYIVSYKVTFPRLIGVLLVFLVLLLRLGKGSVSKSTRTLMTWAIALVLYKFSLDISLHYTGGLDAVTQLLKEMIVILMLPIFEKIGSEKIGIVKSLIVCALPAMFLGFLQIFEPDLNIPQMLPSNSLLITEGITEQYIHAESRIVGTYSLAIGFSVMLGVVAVITWAYGLTGGAIQRRTLAISFLALCVGLMIFTQTRSAIYGIVPSILVAYFIENPKSLKKNLALIFGVVVLFVSFAGIQAFITQYSERSEIKMDANTFYKITANLYGTYAALHRNPFIGVPLPKKDAHGLAVDQQAQELIKEGRRELGDVIKFEKKLRLRATNHNLFAFYLRHYGIVGFILLVVVLYKMYKKILVKESRRDRYMLLGVLVFFLQYSLLHNTQLLETLLIWILLAHGVENVRTISTPVRVQHSTRIIASS